jgi:hypothetical protein
MTKRNAGGRVNGRKRSLRRSRRLFFQFPLLSLERSQHIGRRPTPMYCSRSRPRSPASSRGCQACSYRGRDGGDENKPKGTGTWHPLNILSQQPLGSTQGKVKRQTSVHLASSPFLRDRNATTMRLLLLEENFPRNLAQPEAVCCMLLLRCCSFKAIYEHVV